MVNDFMGICSGKEVRVLGYEINCHVIRSDENQKIGVQYELLSDNLLWA